MVLCCCSIVRHVIFELLFTEIASTVIVDDLGTGILEAGSEYMVLLTASVNQTIAAEVALQVNTAIPPSGTGDGFWSRTLFATVTINIIILKIGQVNLCIQLYANK